MRGKNSVSIISQTHMHFSSISPVFIPRSSGSPAFVSCSVKFCNKQRRAGIAYQNQGSHLSADDRARLLAQCVPLQSYSETSRISLGIMIMAVKQKIHLPTCCLSCFVLSYTQILICNNMNLFLSEQDECYNYIKVLVPRNDETLFACGTNAFNPTCRNYKVRIVAAVGPLASISDKRSYYSYHKMICACVLGCCFLSA